MDGNIHMKLLTGSGAVIIFGISAVINGAIVNWYSTPCGRWHVELFNLNDDNIPI